MVQCLERNRHDEAVCSTFSVNVEARMNQKDQYRPHTDDDPEPAHPSSTSEMAGAGFPAPGTDDDPLILWMLSLTPTRRLEAAQGFAESVWALRHGRLPH